MNRGNPAGFAPKMPGATLETTRIKKDVYTIAELQNMSAREYQEVVLRDSELENQLNAILEAQRTGQPLPPELVEPEAAPVSDIPEEPTV